MERAGSFSNLSNCSGFPKGSSPTPVSLSAQGRVGSTACATCYALRAAPACKPLCTSPPWCSFCPNSVLVAGWSSLEECLDLPVAAYEFTFLSQGCSDCCLLNFSLSTIAQVWSPVLLPLGTVSFFPDLLLELKGVWDMHFLWGGQQKSVGMGTSSVCAHYSKDQGCQKCLQFWLLNY